MQPMTRYHGRLDCRIRLASVSSSPSSLLVPERLHSSFGALLKRSRQRPGILLRKFVQRYRPVCFDGELPQMGTLKRLYQIAGQRLNKVSFRVENSVWLEFGQMAAYLGVSKCFLFVYLIECAAADEFHKPVGTPTFAMADYDLEKPQYLEYRERLCPRGRFCERRLRLIPWDYDEVPYYVRYKSEHG